MPVDDTPENLNYCMDFCGTCPSLPNPPFPFLYCARGNSEAKVDKKGCRCPECPVYRIYDLKGVNGSPYFCEKGKAP